MKLFLVTLCLSVFIFNSAFAQSLKSNMKSSQTLLKQIAATMNDTTKNQENAANVSKMVVFFEAARNQSPDSGSLKNYQELMDQSIVLMKSLKSAFKANDNALVLSIMQKLNTAKKEGHDLYK